MQKHLRPATGFIFIIRIVCAFENEADIANSVPDVGKSPWFGPSLIIDRCAQVPRYCRFILQPPQRFSKAVEKIIGRNRRFTDNLGDCLAIQQLSLELVVEMIFEKMLFRCRVHLIKEVS